MTPPSGRSVPPFGTALLGVGPESLRYDGTGLYFGSLAVASVCTCLCLKYRCCHTRTHTHRGTGQPKLDLLPSPLTGHRREDKHTHTHACGQNQPRALCGQRHLQRRPAQQGIPAFGSPHLCGKILLRGAKWREGGGEGRGGGEGWLGKAGQSNITQCLTLHFQSQPIPC